MKNLLALIFLVSNFSFAQGMMDKPHHHMRERFKELEKIKLLESLNLDEETAIRFFTRRNKFLNEQQKLFNQRENLVKEAENFLKEKNLKDKDYDVMINKIKLVEDKLLNSRQKFFESVEDILTKEQTIKLFIFDYKFKQEIRKMLMKRGKRKFSPE